MRISIRLSIQQNKTSTKHNNTSRFYFFLHSFLHWSAFFRHQNVMARGKQKTKYKVKTKRLIIKFFCTGTLQINLRIFYENILIKKFFTFSVLLFSASNLKLGCYKIEMYYCGDKLVPMRISLVLMPDHQETFSQILKKLKFSI